MVSFLRVVSVHRVGVMLQSIVLECTGQEGTRGFPNRNRKWTCGEASEAMERKRFLLECYTGTAWAVLQPKKPLREILQQALSLQRYCGKWRHLFLNNLLEKKHPLVSWNMSSLKKWL